jgi:hypothetical protein
MRRILGLLFVVVSGEASICRVLVGIHETGSSKVGNHSVPNPETPSLLFYSTIGVWPSPGEPILDQTPFTSFATFLSCLAPSQD